MHSPVAMFFHHLKEVQENVNFKMNFNKLKNSVQSQLSDSFLVDQLVVPIN